MNAAALFARANDLLSQGRAGEAEVIYQQAIESQPGFADAYVNLGVCLKSLGRLPEAEAAYRQAIAARPGFVEALNNLANILNLLGRPAEAEAAYRQALETRPDHVEALINLSRILLLRGLPGEAEPLARRAVTLRPELPETHNGLGAILKAQYRLADAEAAFLQALRIRPGHPEALNQLGNLRQQSGEPGAFEAAEGLYRQALASRPTYAEAHNNLGNSLQEQGRFSEAEACYRRALELVPHYAEAHGHLGAALKSQGRLSEAEAAYRRALELRPGFVVALNNLAQFLIARGQPSEAMPLIQQALENDDQPESRLLFMDCITRFRITHHDETVRGLMIRALRDAWGQAGSLGRVGAEMVRQRMLSAGLLADFSSDDDSAARPKAKGEETIAAAIQTAAADELLLALMAATQIRDAWLEALLTRARRHLLNELVMAADGNATIDRSAARQSAEVAQPALPPGSSDRLKFFSALARQCFINEYVYFADQQELQQVAQLKTKLAAELATGRRVNPEQLLLLAAYLPLHGLPLADCLTGPDESAEIAAVICQQITEPARELALAASVERLTPIEHEVSLAVQQQYAENPYPRWISPEIRLRPQGVNAFIRGRFPQAVVEDLQVSGPLELLVAGSGTGNQPISAAQRFANVRVLAVDLSLPSLCYGKRKAEELGLSNIHFAQADILRLGNLGRSFDVIESAGVLHHLPAIDDGLAVLVSLLRPHGFLQLGLYSRTARRDVIRAREYIAAHGIGTSPAEIRRCRKSLREDDDTESVRAVTRLSDFYGTSTCRDLLFHVQEICIDPLELNELLSRHGLRFLGFDLDPVVGELYRQRFPDDPSATCLSNWDAFERDHPDTFIGMYQFWAQKTESLICK